MSKAGQTLEESVNKMLKLRKRLKETFTSPEAQESLAGTLTASEASEARKEESKD